MAQRRLDQSIDNCWYSRQFDGHTGHQYDASWGYFFMHNWLMSALSVVRILGSWNHDWSCCTVRPIGSLPPGPLIGWSFSGCLRRHRIDVLSGPVFCLMLGVSSVYAQPITGQVTEVTCPVIGRAQPELTPSKRQKTGPALMMGNFKAKVESSRPHGATWLYEFQAPGISYLMIQI